MRQRVETEEASRTGHAGYSASEYPELVRRAQQIRRERDGMISREVLAESAAEVGIREEDLREAERQLAAERAERTRRQLQTRAIAAGMAALLALFLVFSYNSLNGARLGAVEARSNLQAVLQRRADLVPQLARVAREGAGVEKELVDRLARAREGLRSGDVAEQMRANTEFNRVVERITVESNPQFRSTDLYLGLNDEIAGTENRINVARQRYNDAAGRYNRAAQSFPGSLARPVLGLPREMPFFTPQRNVEDPPEL